MELDQLYGVAASLVSGGLLWGVMEVWHMLLGHGAMVTNVGSVALGAVSVVGFYLFSMTDQLDIEFDEKIAGIVLVYIAGIHTAYWFIKPGFISMGLTVALAAFAGTLVLAYADY